jgi:hypothetical protein
LLRISRSPTLPTIPTPLGSFRLVVLALYSSSTCGQLSTPHPGMVLLGSSTPRCTVNRPARWVKHAPRGKFWLYEMHVRHILTAEKLQLALQFYHLSIHTSDVQYHGLRGIHVLRKPHVALHSLRVSTKPSRRYVCIY